MKRPGKRKHSLLWQVGLLAAVLFTAVILINGVSIYRSSRDNQMHMLESHTGDIMRQTRSSMEEYAALPWLLDYWTAHAAELSGENADADAVDAALAEQGLYRMREVTPEQAESLSEPLRRQFAARCYMDIARRFVSMRKDFGLTQLTCLALPDFENPIPYFKSDGADGGEAVSCLGEEWPFHAELHPAVLELYELREDRAYYETVTSTIDGTEYLYGYLPLMEDGAIRCYVSAGFTTTEIRRALRLSMGTVEWVNAGVLLTAAVVLVLLTNVIVLRPLQLVQMCMRGYRDTKDSERAMADMEQVGFRNEIGALAGDFIALTVEIDQYTSDVAALSAEKERVSTELNMATRIQSNMLPNTFPAFPDRGEFGIFASMDPAKEVGGDFYDFFLIDGDHLGLVVADVSGKGVPAALFMMTARTILKTKAQSNPGLSPKDILTEVNAALSENNEEDMFVTVWFGVLTISTGELTYADAGHEKLLLYQNGQWSYLPKDGGVALAVWSPEDLELLGESYQFRDRTLRLCPGDAIFQYTDGVTEASNADDELFGEERLLAAMNAAPSAEPEELLPHVRARIDAFVKGAPQFDDITMLALRYHGAEGNS